MKKYLSKIGVHIAMMSVFFFSCSKGVEAVDPAQTNITVTANIVGATAQNPNGDGSGTVIFTVNGTKASTYKILLGNGETKEFSNEKFSYAYTTSGTNSYVVYVSAYNSGKLVSSTTLSLNVYVAPSLLWSDEFSDNGSPNPSKWGYDLGAGGWGNNESQYYTNRPENVVVENGILKIKTLKENYSGSSYTSARILTKGKFSFKYGKVEVRAKLPTGKGTWSAFWMLGTNIDAVGWPACGEIDILESVGNNLNVNHSSMHSPGRSGNTPDTATTFVTNGNTEFHTYTADWRADSIKFYVDDKLFYTFTNTTNFPFHQNFFLILNCAMGGTFGGAIDPNFTSSVFEIDYVRVYN
ncbi:MAG: glycoside hydrolase family 16 protein [Sphingobacteriaceae bacterium]|nr:glycoside hydrolase family 16 protein [Sphingobacteriaceae bacterium]